ncbi:MAG: PSD1 and planctomycete cytochrome C domain-containing protein [Aureliella sp.]
MRIAFTIAVLCFAPSASFATDEEIDFAKDVEPIFAAHCADCHNADDSGGGLNLSSSSVFAAGDSGEIAVVAGDAAGSELIRRVTAADEDRRMPPEESPLSDEQIATLEKWIQAGAPVPDAMRSSTDGPKVVESDHWSLQPVRDPAVPADGKSWAQNPIDQFVARQQFASQVHVVADASPIVMVRRIAYTLTGLPPTPEEVGEFEAQAKRDGIEAAVASWTDELLGRRTYGQRWGRHWMDWVRYADTAGDNSDFPIPEAYLYRNYIVDSFNADTPYDQFLTEQIAGDLLPADSLAERNRLNIATGYLAMARRFGSLIERYPWHLTIEDTIDNMGRTMMGLTISCARCHDHKFDPISTRDYYGLYGIFDSTQYPFPGIELFQSQNNMVPLVDEEEVAKVLGPFLEKKRELEKKLEQALAASEAMALENEKRSVGASIGEQRKLRDKLDSMLLKTRKAGTALSDHIKTLPPVPVAYAVTDRKPRDARVQIKGEPTRPGAIVPRKFPDVLGAHQLPSDVAESGSGRLELARWITSEDNPLTARVIVNRVWQRHFGQGIVRSTSDFGLRGEDPSHPELLDWITKRFIEDGWSIKQLHRMILNSRTYRLSSNDSKKSLVADPENRLLWKFTRQRLDAESLRDTLLALSGQLDLQPQTEPYAIPPQKDWKYTQHHPFKDDYPSNKRSLYQMTKRLTAKPYLQTFDGADPNVCTSDRDQSVTPLQALYFVNDEFFHAQSQLIAESLSTADTDQTARADSEKLEHLFTKILCRKVASDELDLLTDHLVAMRERVSADSEADRELAVWSSVVRSLLRTNEFLYLD